MLESGCFGIEIKLRDRGMKSCPKSYLVMDVSKSKEMGEIGNLGLASRVKSG